MLDGLEFAIDGLGNVRGGGFVIVGAPGRISMQFFGFRVGLMRIRNQNNGIRLVHQHLSAGCTPRINRLTETERSSTGAI